VASEHSALKTYVGKPTTPPPAIPVLGRTRCIRNSPSHARGSGERLRQVTRNTSSLDPDEYATRGAPAVVGHGSAGPNGKAAPLGAPSTPKNRALSSVKFCQTTRYTSRLSL
jgi:hypothetical protein